MGFLLMVEMIIRTNTKKCLSVVKVLLLLPRRIGRVVDCGSLENYCTERYRGFESLILRQEKIKGLSFETFFLCIRMRTHWFEPEHSVAHLTFTEWNGLIIPHSPLIKIRKPRIVKIQGFLLLVYSIYSPQCYLNIGEELFRSKFIFN